MEPSLAICGRLSQGMASAAELAQSLRVSQATISRSMRVLEGNGTVLRMGTTRGARYALRRQIPGIGSQWPLYQVDPGGRVQQLGTVAALAQGAYFTDASLPRLRGFSGALPYFLQDAWPAGFLGRAIPALFPELGLPARIDHWTEEQAMIYLARRAAESSGDLILGEETLSRHLGADPMALAIAAAERTTRYPQFADAAMAGHPPGSSAQGEHPKFTAVITEGARCRHMLVKFSPPVDSPAGQRWADLLRAEHLAHGVLQEAGIAACQSTLLEAGARVFLECVRFDREGLEGRCGTVSLFALDSARYGRLDSWSACARRLCAEGLLATDHVEVLCLLDAFGALIANTDRHLGNVTLYDRYEGPFEPAPAYDMLPMLFAPQNDQIVPRSYVPPAPAVEWLRVWPRAHELAAVYWQRLAEEPRLSAGFRALCEECLKAVRGMPLRSVAV